MKCLLRGQSLKNPHVMRWFCPLVSLREGKAELSPPSPRRPSGSCPYTQAPETITWGFCPSIRFDELSNPPADFPWKGLTESARTPSCLSRGQLRKTKQAKNPPLVKGWFGREEPLPRPAPLCCWKTLQPFERESAGQKYSGGFFFFLSD